MYFNWTKMIAPIKPNYFGFASNLALNTNNYRDVALTRLSANLGMHDFKINIDKQINSMTAIGALKIKDTAALASVRSHADLGFLSLKGNIDSMSAIGALKIKDTAALASMRSHADLGFLSLKGNIDKQIHSISAIGASKIKDPAAKKSFAYKDIGLTSTVNGLRKPMELIFARQAALGRSYSESAAKMSSAMESFQRPITLSMENQAALARSFSESTAKMSSVYKDMFLYSSVNNIQNPINTLMMKDFYSENLVTNGLRSFLKTTTKYQVDFVSNAVKEICNIGKFVNNQFNTQKTNWISAIDDIDNDQVIVVENQIETISPIGPKRILSVDEINKLHKEIICRRNALIIDINQMPAFVRWLIDALLGSLIWELVKYTYNILK